MNRALLSALLGLLLACTKKEAAPATPATPAAPAAPAEEGPGAEEVKPVYSSFNGPPLPLAEKLCAALHQLPATRRAQCCKGQPGTEMSGECTRIVSGALRNGAVTLEAAAVEKCAAAQARAFEGCSWVGQWLNPLPPECAGLFAGKLKAGAVCRSSLECQDGLHCDGVGPLDPGRCAGPRPEGQVCLTAVDSLVAYARANDDARHPECDGYCGHRRCQARVAAGGECSFARQCQEGQHCDGSKCVANAFAATGDKCVGGSCAPGARCVAGTCLVPKPDGAACKSDAECRGGCLADTHVCGMRCDQR